MYKKEEYREFKLEFWQAFDRYTDFFSMKIGVPVEWMLYKTGIKDLELKFDVQPKSVRVVLESASRDFDRRFDIYAELDNYKAVLFDGIETEWEWDDSFTLESGKRVGRVFIELPISFHNRDSWPEIFSFMATNMYQLQTNFQEILPILKEKFGRPTLNLDDFFLE